MGAADAHDAGSPGGARPKWGQLMLMMRARQGVQSKNGGSRCSCCGLGRGFKAKVGAADAHDACSPGGSRPKWGQLMPSGFKAKGGAADARDAGSPGGSRPKWGQRCSRCGLARGFKAKVGAADAHDACLPGCSRPKWEQLMLMMRARQGVQGQSGGS